MEAEAETKATRKIGRRLGASGRLRAREGSPALQFPISAVRDFLGNISSFLFIHVFEKPQLPRNYILRRKERLKKFFLSFFISLT